MNGKREERRAAALLGGWRYPASSGGVVDVEAPGILAQVKHVKRFSLAALERLALEAEQAGLKKGKVGIVIVKRRPGRGMRTPRLVVLTEPAWRALAPGAEASPVESRP